MKLPSYKQLVLLSIAIAFAMTCFAAYLSNRIAIVEQRYDDLYRHKENILNELLSQGKNTECDTILYYNLDEVSPEAMFVDTAIIDNPSVIIHCNGFWNRLKGTSTAKKGQSLHSADVYVNGKKIQKKSVCVDFY